jgi:hypothetical protein
MPSQISAAPAQPRINNSIVVEAKRNSAQEGTFATLLDAANPLQHVPGISHAYQALTKDKISPGASLAGKVAIGGAVAGPIGMAVGAGVFVVERVIPGVFKAIGRLFGAGGGEGSTGQAKAPAIRLPEGSVSANANPQRLSARAPQAQAGLPLEQLEQASRAQSAQVTNKGAQSALAPAKGGAWPQLSPTQFDSLMQAFQPALAQPGPSDAGDKEQRRDNMGAKGADIAAQMQANMEKYRAFKQQQ